AIDNPSQIEFIRRRAAECGLVRVLPSGCITNERKGLQLADLSGMAAAGAVAFTDDGATVADDGLMRSAMKIARQLGIPVMDHALDPTLAGRGVVHDGILGHALGLPVIPSSAETKIVVRDIELSAETGCAVHIQHLSAAESIDAIRGAISRRLPVSCEVTPHHIALCDADVRSNNTSTKVNPPLRAASDREALIAAVRQGIIQAFATDHAPHTGASKLRDFTKAPFGLIGLETAVGVTYTALVKTGLISLSTWLKLWTSGPARVINKIPPSMKTGSPADIVLLDLDTEWTVRRHDFVSKSSNSPFTDRTLTGSAALTLLAGTLTWDAGTGRIDKYA
ncbi:MAG: dihydroorotase, partial [bacterium]